MGPNGAGEWFRSLPDQWCGMIAKNPIKTSLAILALIGAFYAPLVIPSWREPPSPPKKFVAKDHCNYTQRVENIHKPRSMSFGQDCLAVTQVIDEGQDASETPNIPGNDIFVLWGNLLRWLVFKTITDPVALFTLILAFGTGILAWYTYRLVRDGRENAIIENRAWLKIDVPMHTQISYGSPESTAGFVTVTINCRNIGKSIARNVGIDIEMVRLSEGDTYQGAYQRMLDRNRNFQEFLFPQDNRMPLIRVGDYPVRVRNPSEIVQVGVVVVAFYKIEGSPKERTTPMFLHASPVINALSSEIITHPMGPDVLVALIAPADPQRLQGIDITPT